jgi:hypothetical protein
MLWCDDRLLYVCREEGQVMSHAHKATPTLHMLSGGHASILMLCLCA